MSFLPIVERELRTAARKSSIYRARTAAVLVTTVFGAALLFAGEGTTGRQMGRGTFRLLTGLAFAYCALAGCRYAADCLSQEKREGTLGLLFLTPLRGHDVVLGKLVTVSARTVHGLFAFFPVLAITLVMGGVTVGEFWRAVVVLMATLLLALSSSLWVSTHSRESHLALGAAFLLFVFLALAPLFADWSISWLGHAPAGRICWVSLAAAATLTSDGYRLNPGAFWAGLLLNCILSCGFLALASVALPRAWQERPVAGGLAKVDHALASQKARTAVGREPACVGCDDRSVALKSSRRELLDNHPICWLAARHDGRGVTRALFIAGIACSAAVAVALAWISGGSTFGLTAVSTSAAQLFLKVWLAWRACATLAEARKTGVVELLLATPLKIEDIIRGHWQALLRTFVWPVVAVLILMVFPIWQTLLREPALAWGFPGLGIPGFAALGIITFLFDLAAVAWLGMWMGLSQPSAVQAFGKTLLLAVIVPALVFCLPNLLLDLFWISWARRKLEHEFRNAVAARHAPWPQTSAWLSPQRRLAVPPVIR